MLHTLEDYFKEYNYNTNRRGLFLSTEILLLSSNYKQTSKGQKNIIIMANSTGKLPC